MDQVDLFSTEKTEQEIPLGGFGVLRYFPAWLEKQDADRLYSVLNEELRWQQPNVMIYGQERRIPRLQAWYGDAGAQMLYSGKCFDPLKWHPHLLTLRNRLQERFCYPFNSVLANCYRDGNDSVSWHADDEPELGDCPVIASLSLGTSRRFSLKPKSPRLANAQMSPVHLNLAHGDLLIMAGETQKYWHHAILKDRHCANPRINLTYRHIKN